MKSAKIENGKIVNVVEGELEGYVAIPAEIEDRAAKGWRHSASSGFTPPAPTAEELVAAADAEAASRMPENTGDDELLKLMAQEACARANGESSDEILQSIDTLVNSRNQVASKQAELVVRISQMSASERRELDVSDDKHWT